MLLGWGEIGVEHVQARHFEIRADDHSCCTYGLLAFSDINHGGVLAPGYCAMTRKWLEDRVTGKAGELGHGPIRVATGSGGVTLAPPGDPAKEPVSAGGGGVTPAPSGGVVASEGGGVILAPEEKRQPVLITTRGNAIGDVTGEGISLCDMP